MSSSTTNGSSSHAITTTTNTSDMEIPTIFGLPWVTPTFDPSVTDIVPTMHTSSYPAINPALNPLLSQAGKTVLITGATAGIGFAMAKSFVTASASKVIITGRRQERLDEAVGLLRQHAKELGKQTEVVSEKSDAANMEEIDVLWKKLGEEGEVVDVLILNAVGEMAAGGLCEDGGRTTVEIWAKLEANLRGPMRYTELFMKQGKERQKFLINISTASAHISFPEYSPALSSSPEYGFTKATAGLFFRYIAQRSDPEKMQVVSIHPGTIYSELWQGLGVEKSVLPFDDISLPADFAVWATTKEARFIHGRFVWANWDVEELKAKYAERFKEDAELFRFGVCGLAGSKLHVIQ
ncbi:uncharacterized protein NCU08784 [Neurospora crassa OR74A]|uniref:NAD(P)-binding protein n=1 Tax=Neurospora crassa (strain ATCC 24698 / 74-OR23-1A / CBS 708.71 / DSM 1257 / FGSC 987) TaxID=367110 RepID=U9W3Q4_NEUCR|nr:hypothetical protein NCU08784 [Neurospora crassa OR74A]XP_011393967.1 uncharacterized protein NCU08784 [Neurospora crassa OR74A]ESA43461.1 hypothetical protein NCU08784 [Neurospora crassa OR74A]ESA43462.1 hypothetical protein, variant [Neurospora crassa OR74A]|eukprot:XP_011393966.1 hypothetical protein NCU08784 [Neurospora crassa OR74A]